MAKVCIFLLFLLPAIGGNAQIVDIVKTACEDQKFELHNTLPIAEIGGSLKTVFDNGIKEVCPTVKGSYCINVSEKGSIGSVSSCLHKSLSSNPEIISLRNKTPKVVVALAIGEILKVELPKEARDWEIAEYLGVKAAYKAGGHFELYDEIFHWTQKKRWHKNKLLAMALEIEVIKASKGEMNLTDFYLLLREQKDFSIHAVAAATKKQIGKFSKGFWESYQAGTLDLSNYIFQAGLEQKLNSKTSKLDLRPISPINENYKLVFNGLFID